jgi:hypothetical protein
VDSSFLIISGILLNLIACGLVIRPVPIEPAEKEKRLKRLKKLSPKKNRPNKEINAKIIEENEKIPLESKTYEDSLLEGEINKTINEDSTGKIRRKSIEIEQDFPDELSKKKTLKEKIQSFIDFSLFSDIIFMFFGASNFLTSLGY